MNDDPEIILRPAARNRAAPVAARRYGRVEIWPGVLEAMDGHVGEDTTVEHGGVMVGGVDRERGTTIVSGSIRAAGSVSAVASLTFTHETWDHINEVMERDHPDEHIIGWYHSHPHFGIFLSDHDKFIHRNFFARPWQIAYVRDPLLDQRGFFAWADGDITELGVDDWVITGPVGATPAAPSRAGPPGVVRERRRWPLAAVLLVLALVAAVVVVPRAWQRDAAEVAATLELRPPEERVGPPGTAITIGSLSVDATDEDGVVVIRANAAGGERGEVPIEVLGAAANHGTSGRYVLQADPPVGAPDGTYEGSVLVAVCPDVDHCEGAPTSEDQPFQVSVTTGGPVAVPQRTRWVDSSEPGLAVLSDEVLVYGLANPVDKVAELGGPGAQRLAQQEAGAEGEELSQIAWPSAAVPDLDALTAADEVDRHYGFTAPEPVRLEPVDGAEVRTQVGLDSTGADPTSGVVVSTLSATRRVPGAICASGVTDRCEGSRSVPFPRGIGAAHRVAVAELTNAMAEAADGADVVFVGWDLPHCGSVGPSATGPVADLWDALAAPVRAHPETLWVFSADAAENRSCGADGTVAVQLGRELDNAIAVSSDDEDDDTVYGIHVDSGDDDMTDDISAGAVVTSIAVELWPGGPGAADTVADCLERADRAGPLDLSEGC